MRPGRPWKGGVPTGIPKRTRVGFYLAGAVSLLAWSALRWVAPGGEIPWTEAMRRAASRMDSALTVVAGHCALQGISIEGTADPNGTCLVGPDFSPLFTSLGQLEAKRTTTNPDMAGLLAHLLSEAGVGEGDCVAIGASGSFPGLLVASLAAVEALGAEPRVILSLGASSFGATRPEFHLLDLFQVLASEGLVSVPAAAVSLGGEADVGGGFDPAFREELTEALLQGTVPVLQRPFSGGGLQERMAIYGLGPEGQAGGSPEAPAAFINIGGAEANLGTSPEILSVPPGLVRVGAEVQEPIDDGGSPGSRVHGRFGSEFHLRDLPPAHQRGVLFEMLARRVPVIHLLHVRGLALRFGLAWDPVPLPAPGTSRFSDVREGKGTSFWLLTAVYALALALVAWTSIRPVRQTG